MADSELNGRSKIAQLLNELRVKQQQIDKQTAAIAHLNNTVRAKDAELAKSGHLILELQSLRTENAAMGADIAVLKRDCAETRSHLQTMSSKLDAVLSLF